MFELDIDRLHNVVLRDSVGKGCGKTVANIYKLIGFIQTSGEENFFICQTEHSIRYTFRMIVDIFKSEEIVISRVRGWNNPDCFVVIWEGREKIVHLLKNVEIKTKLEGLFGNIIVNDCVDKLHFY